MDTAQWAQGIGVVKVAQPPPQPHMEVSNNPKVVTASPSCMLERRAARPAKEQALNCPRCNSTNTKFCYYNNYSLSQPRYFCKACRRYWTEGGSLRNVPVGGGSRKNKRSAPSTTPPPPPPPPAKKLNIPDLAPQSCSINFPNSASQNPKIQHGQDLNLSYPPPNHDVSKFIELPFSANAHDDKAHQNHASSAMELLKTGIGAASSRGLGSFMPVSLPDSGGAMYGSAGFPMQDFKPGLNFGLEGFENGYGGFHGVHEEGNTGARMLFPVEDLKQHQQVHDDQQNRSGADSAPHHGYWNGMLGGGGGSW